MKDAARLGLLMLVALASGCSSNSARTEAGSIDPYPAPPSGIKKLRAAVTEFRDRTDSHLSWRAGEQFETLAALTGRFDLLTREQFRQALKEQNLDGIQDPSELAKSGKVRGVDYLILGEVNRFQSTMTEPVDLKNLALQLDIAVEVRLIDARTGDILASRPGVFIRDVSRVAFGLRVVSLTSRETNNAKLAGDSQEKLLRLALDDAIRRMLPDLDGKSR